MESFKNVLHKMLTARRPTALYNCIGFYYCHTCNLPPPLVVADPARCQTRNQEEENYGTAYIVHEKD